MSKSRAACGLTAAIAFVLCLAAWRGGQVEAANSEDPGAGQPVVAELSRDGQTVAYFKHVEGLAPAIAGPGQSTAKTPREVHLTRGLSSSRDVWDWRLAFLQGTTPKGELTIRFLDATFQEVAAWQLDRAYPAAVSDSMTEGVASEELVIGYEGLRMIKP